MTKKLYEIDAYIKDCSATIVDCETINGATWLSLDQTIFYPEGGGQPADYGLIDDVSVLDVQVKGETIFHKLEKPIDKSRVKLKLDYLRRFDHMQQHTGQHLLSAVWLELFGYPTIAFHLGKESCTIDLQTDKLELEQVRTVEGKVADYIFENRTVDHFLLPYDEVPEEKLEKLKHKPPFVRIVEIDGIDTSSCCGTHVRALGELGLLKIIGWEKYKQHIRLSFVCGKRAYHRFQEISQTVAEISKKLHAPSDLILDRFTALYEGNQMLKKSYQKLYEQALCKEAEELCRDETNVIERSWSKRPIQELKDLAKIIIEIGRNVVIFHNKSENMWVFAATSSELFHVAACINQLKESFGGKGGGNAVFGQWSGELDASRWLEIKGELLNCD